MKNASPYLFNKSLYLSLLPSFPTLFLSVPFSRSDFANEDYDLSDANWTEALALRAIYANPALSL